MAVAAAVAELCATPEAMAVRHRYHEPWRHYHDWAHPLAMLRLLASAEADGVAVADPVAAVGFVLWHDAIYDPQGAPGRNEQLSAALCETEMLGAPASLERTVAAILATINHCVPDAVVCPDGALLLDIDLAILGAAPTDFDNYDRQIAAEYVHVAPEAYRNGRAAVLRRFIERDRIYLTNWGFTRWEARARTNLARTIEALER